MPESSQWLHEETLRGGQMASLVLKRGQTLRLTDVDGGACLSALLFNADFPLERYNMPDTLKAQHIARLTAGNVLYSDMGRVLCSVVADSLGWHDTITGVMDARAMTEKYGLGSYQALRNERHRNGRDNLLVELAKFGLGRRDFGPNVNFFVKVEPDQSGQLRFITAHSPPGSSVELRAELNTLLVLSATPHPLDPEPRYLPESVKLSVRAGEVATADDPCFRSCPENARGFALTEAYFR
jgi:urea carboxylase-associated protein 2